MGHLFKSVGYISVSTIIFAVLFSTACSWFGEGSSGAFEAVEALIEQTSSQVTRWCEAGYLPPVACEEWEELYTQLGENLEYLKGKWSLLKEKIINYIIRFLSGLFHDGDTPQRFPLPDSLGILDAAQKATEAGYLTPEELEEIRKAVP